MDRPDDVEEMLESELDLSLWSLNGNKELKTSSNIKKNQTKPGKYWINTNSDTRHNSSCRYYGTTKERYYTNQKIGKLGKISVGYTNMDCFYINITNDHWGI